MAVSGTSIPADAGKQNTIPSVPRPDQIPGNPAFSHGGLGATDMQTAADNATDMPRSGRGDGGATGEVMTGTGHTLPATVEGKRMHDYGSAAAAHGRPRADEHAKQKGSDMEEKARPGVGDGSGSVAGEDAVAKGAS